MPTTAVLALDRHGAIAGTASALMGTLQFVTGALVMAVVGLFVDGSSRPMVAGIALCSLVVLAMSWTTLGRRTPLIGGRTAAATGYQTRPETDMAFLRKAFLPCGSSISLASSVYNSWSLCALADARLTIALATAPICCASSDSIRASMAGSKTGAGGVQAGRQCVGAGRARSLVRLPCAGPGWRCMFA